MKCKLIFITLILSVNLSYSSNVKFYNVNDLYGISMRETASVCKDSNGFIWASSRTGIMRLSGYDCRIYPIPYETTDIINVKLKYKNNNLIAYTNNGQIFCFNSVYDRFDFIINLSSVLNNRHLSVHSAIIDYQGDIWISSSMGLHKYHEGEITLVENNDSDLRSIEFDENHILFIKGDEIRLLDIKTQTSECIYTNNTLSAIPSITPHYYDNVEKRLWVGTRLNGIYYFDLTEKTFAPIAIQPSTRQPVNAIRAYTDSTILLGVDGQGIWEINKKGDRILNIYKGNADDPLSLRGNGVYDIFIDSDKRVWVCTYTGGLSFFEKTSPLVNQITHKVNNTNSLSDNNVNKVIEDRQGNFWFATDNGISCWDVNTDKWKTFYHNNEKQAQVFLSLCEDNDGRIWAGTFSSGVYILDGKTGKELAHYSNEAKSYSFISNFVFDIFKDSTGDIWLGGMSGNSVCYISKDNKFKSYGVLPVYALTELSPSQILAACTFGLILIDKMTDRVETLLYGYLLQDVLVMDKNIWLCTSGDGLVRFDINNKTTEKFTTESGLPSNFVNSIIEAGGYLWLGTESGICRFNPQEKSAQIFTSLFPLNSVSFNRKAHCKLKNGNIAFGTSNGVLLFDPESLQEVELEGRIYFQDFIVSGRSIRENPIFKLNTTLDSLSEITLKHSHNNLSLELLPLGTSSLGLKFSWRMVDLDKEWNNPSTHNRLTYTNIPAGSYTLEVRMYNSSLSQVIAERRLLVHVTPPFWESRWFSLLVFTFIIGIIYFSLRFYINKLKQKHSEDKVRFFANMAHDVRTALTLIKAPIEELNKETDLSEKGKHYLSLATQQSMHLSSVATQLLDFQKTDINKGQLSLSMIDVVKLIANRQAMHESFAKSHNIKLLYHYSPSEYWTAIDGAMMEKVIDNLISNAIKYSHPESQVHILFAGTPQKWTLEVKDNGIGISQKAQKKLFKEFYRSDNAINSKTIGSGIGLLLAKNYITLHKGNIEFSSQENIGSTFKITVPFKEVQKKEIFVLSDEKSSLSPSEISVVRENTEQKDMRILIVEDNDDLRNFMKYALHDNFEISTAIDGIQAWEMIQQHKNDLIISDVMMPNMDGFELCRLIKSTYETSHIPVILLTSMTEKAQQLHGLGLGADDYLTKPFEMTLLIGRITSIIQNRKKVREKALKLIDENNQAQILSNELNDKFVKKAVEVIRSNITNTEFGKDDFASAMNVSSSLLYKKIKSFTDQSPVDFIKTIRLNHALELLQSHKYSVTEVSELCGFSDASYFSKAFRKYFSKSPTEV